MLMPWNDKNVTHLRELWDQGLPTAQIGKLLGFTKNAVVGKAHRIGLERRPSPIRRTETKPDRKKARSPIMPKLNFENNGNQKNESLNVSNKYSFKSGFDAITACNATADALSPAVQDLIKATINHRDFAKLFDKS